jgi:hypothetical protein
MVGDPGIEPGVRLREGVTVLTKLINFNGVFVFDPKQTVKIRNAIGTSLFWRSAMRRGGKYRHEGREPEVRCVRHQRKLCAESVFCKVT